MYVLETGWSALLPVSHLGEVVARVRLAVMSCADRLQPGGDYGSPMKAKSEAFTLSISQTWLICH